MNKKKILVAEDDEGILDVVQLILEDEGYHVLTAKDSTAFHTAIANEVPDIILLDIWLPGESGTVLAKQLKQSAEKKHIPIIMVSASSDTKEKAAEAGADDFLLKPFEIESLLAIVKQHLPS